MLTLPAITVGTVPIQVPVPSRAMVQLLIANESGSVLTVDTGDGFSRPLPAGLQDVYELGDQQYVTLTPSQLTTASPPSSVVICTFMGANERLDPSTYPVPVVRQIAAFAKPALALKVSLPGSPTTGFVTLPDGTLSLEIVTVVTAGDTGNLNLSGEAPPNGSGFGYYGQQLGTSAYELVGVDANIDPVLVYNIGHGGGAGVTWYVTALPTPPPTFIQRLPAPWQVPFLDQPLNQVIPHGSSFTWLTPPSGEALRLFHMFAHWRTSTNGFGKIEGSGTSGVLRQYDQVASSWLLHDFKGRKLAVNESLVITNDDTANGQAMIGGIGASSE